MKVAYNNREFYKKEKCENLYKQYEKNNEKLPKDKYKYELEIVKECSYKTTSIEINLESKCKDKCIDIDLDKAYYTKIIGTIKDENDNWVKNSKVSLFKSQLINYKTSYILICNMTTDEYGKFEVLINDYSKQDHYVVRVVEEQ